MRAAETRQRGVTVAPASAKGTAELSPHLSGATANDRKNRTTYAAIVAPARAVWLARLEAAWQPVPPPVLPDLYRVMGGVLMLRLLRRPWTDLTAADPRAVDAARTMLRGWIDACVDDPSFVPPECERGNPKDTARAALLEFWSLHWGGIGGE